MTLILISGLLVRCEKRSEFSGKRGRLVVMQSSVSIGDPHIVSDSSNRLSIIRTVYEALVGMDEAGHYEPSLATGWSVEPDARTWTFTIRSGVTFHNGEVLTAEDVVATLGRVLDPAIGGAFGTQGVFASYLGTAEIEAIDDLKFRIVTPQPMADLLDLIVAMPISPRNELAKLPGYYVGTGPYRVASHNAKEVILKAHEDYWGEDPAFQEIRFVAESGSAKRVRSLIRGKADIVSDIDVLDTPPIEENASATLHELKSGLCIIFMFNAMEGPCQDRRVRQALNYGVDVDRIIAEIKHGAAAPLNGFLTPHHFGYDPETSVFPYDPEKARDLLAEAGYTDGLRLTFDIPSVMPGEAPELIRMIADQLDRIGITIEVVEHSDRAAYSEMVRDKQIHDACCFDSSPRSTYRVLREKIQSDLRGPWWQGYENTQVNAMIERAAATLDDAERQRIYRRIYAMITEDAPWLFLYRPTRYYGVGSALGDWSPRADGLLIFD